MNQYYETLKNSKEGVSIGMRNLLTGKEIVEYQNHVKKLNKLEKKLLPLEELIYGSIEEIFILPQYCEKSNGIYHRFSITVMDQSINMHSLIPEIKNATHYQVYPLSQVGWNYPEILLTFRKLDKIKKDQIKKEQSRFIARAKRFPKDEYSDKEAMDEYIRWVKCQPEYLKIGMKNDMLEKFFFFMYYYMDVMDYMLSDMDFEQLKLKTGEYVMEVEKIVKNLPKKFDLPSRSDFAKFAKPYIKSYSISMKGIIYDVMEIIKIISTQMEDIELKLKQHPEYVTIKSEYEQTMTLVENFERKIKRKMRN